MRFQLASDLHLECPANAAWLAAHPLPVAGDVLLLAGDIAPLGRLHEPTVSRFMEWCSRHFAATFWVPGNHEFSGDGSPDVADSLPSFDFHVKRGVRLCNCVEVRPQKHLSLFLTTLWSPVDMEQQAAVDAGMCDCNGSVTCRGHTFRAADYTPLHTACLNWLKHAVATSDAERKIVVTHHCPVPVEDPAFAGNGLTPAFVSDQREWMGECGADCWIFGHTHYNEAHGQLYGHCRLLTNQLGPLLPTFAPACTFSAGA